VIRRRRLARGKRVRWACFAGGCRFHSPPSISCFTHRHTTPTPYPTYSTVCAAGGPECGHLLRGLAHNQFTSCADCRYCLCTASTTPPTTTTTSISTLLTRFKRRRHLQKSHLLETQSDALRTNIPRNRRSMITSSVPPTASSYLERSSFHSLLCS